MSARANTTHNDLAVYGLSPQFLRRIEGHPSNQLVRIVARDVSRFAGADHPQLAHLPRLRRQVRWQRLLSMLLPLRR
jgi:hypothetical protein